MIKQYFDKTMIHFDIDIVLMFLKYLTDEQKEQFVDDRLALVKEKLDIINDKMGKEVLVPEELSYIHVLNYLDHHLKAELNWLRSLKK
jgi:hypothetical protein